MMTPQEHLAEAERLCEAAKADIRENITETTSQTDALKVELRAKWAVNFANLHCLLADTRIKVRR